MIEDLTVRNLSPATQRSYISAVSKFSRYKGRFIRVEARRENAERLALIVPARNEGGAECVGVPAILHAGRCARPRTCGTRHSLISHLLQHGLLSQRGEHIKTLKTDKGRVGTGETRWKVQGVLD